MVRAVAPLVWVQAEPHHFRQLPCPPCLDVRGLQGFHPLYLLPMSLLLVHPRHLTDLVRVVDGPFSTVS